MAQAHASIGVVSLLSMLIARFDPELRINCRPCISVWRAHVGPHPLPQEIAARSYVCPDLSSPAYQCLGYLRNFEHPQSVRLLAPSSRNPGQHDRHPQASRHTRLFHNLLPIGRVGHSLACQCIHLRCGRFSDRHHRHRIPLAPSHGCHQDRRRPPIRRAKYSLQKLCSRRSEFPRLGSQFPNHWSSDFTRVAEIARYGECEGSTTTTYVRVRHKKSYLTRARYSTSIP